MGTRTQKSKIDKSALRSHIEYEAGLLNTRTGIVLVKQQPTRGGGTGRESFRSKFYYDLLFDYYMFALDYCRLLTLLHPKQTNKKISITIRNKKR